MLHTITTGGRSAGNTVYLHLINGETEFSRICDLYHITELSRDEARPQKWDNIVALYRTALNCSSIGKNEVWVAKIEFWKERSQTCLH